MLDIAGDMFDDHLKAVQNVLKEWGEPEPVCRAGLFHSIYGTQGAHAGTTDSSAM
jgi:hypothetical protein